MAETKKAPTAEMKKLELGKDAAADPSKPKTPTSPQPLSPKSPTSPTTPTSPTGGGAGIGRNPSAIKETMLNWCKAMCEGYEHVNITNFSSSWADGMAFCALIHHFYPNAFDYSKLNPKNRRGNFKLAFDVAEKLADISPLLEVEDMVRMKNNPDWKCVFTYVQSFYRRFAIKQQQQQQQSQDAKKEESDDKKTETKDGDDAAKDSTTNDENTSSEVAKTE